MAMVRRLTKRKTKAKRRSYTKGKKGNAAASLKITDGMTFQQRERYYVFHDPKRKEYRRQATEQMVKDLHTCSELGDAALYKDVKLSKGFRNKRRLWDKKGRVSDGFYDGRIWWPLVAEEDADGVP